MNYLAHAYLSFNQPEILLGNMISDFVKGKRKFDYSTGIQKGIALHRVIDEFTDNHSATKEAKEFFRPAYRLYSGAFIDVVYDHFLAQDKNEFLTAEKLQDFTDRVYQTLEENSLLLPSRFQMLFPHMKEHNWLYNYQFSSGIESSLGGLVRRAKYLNESATAFNILNNNYDELKHCYESFFPELKIFSSGYLRNLLLH